MKIKESCYLAAEYSCEMVVIVQSNYGDVIARFSYSGDFTFPFDKYDVAIFKVKPKQHEKSNSIL